MGRWTDGGRGTGGEWTDRELINRPSLSEPGRLCSLLTSDAILGQMIYLEKSQSPNNLITSLTMESMENPGPNRGRRLIIKDKWVSAPQTKLTGFEMQIISFHH